MKKENIILLIIFIILTILLIIIVNKNNQPNTTPKETQELKLVIDYSKFYTIENCANKFYTNLSTNNTQNIKNLLDDNYKEEYQNKYQNKNISIKVNEMYYINNNYYLKGYIYEELINKINKLNEEYLLIKLNDNEKLFTVTPLTKQEYKEVTNG